MRKTDKIKAVNNLIEYLINGYTALSRPGGRYMRAQEKRMTTRKLKAVFNKQMKWLIDRLADVEPFKSNDDEDVKIIKTKAIEDSINDILEEMPYNDKIVEAMTFYSGASLVKGGNYRMRKMKIGNIVGTWDLQTPEVKRYLQNMEELQLSNYKGAIQRTTKKRIRKIVIQGAENGDSYTAISKAIKAEGTAGVFSQARGELIATREIGKAYGTGQHSVVQKYVAKTGATVKKNWLTVGDDKVRPEHTMNEEDGDIPLEDNFSGTDEEFAPSDDFRCRCVSNYHTI